MKIWEIYLLKRLMKRFLFVLFSLILLFIVIDYASHISSFQLLPSKEITKYYLFELSRKADILVSFSFLLAALSLKESMQTSGEMVLLQKMGLSKRRISLPFFKIAFMLTFFLILNQQYILPESSFSLHKVGAKLFEKASLKGKKGIHSLYLKDGSLLLFLDANETAIYNVFWIKDLNNITRIRSIHYKENNKSFDVETFQRNGAGALLRTKILPEETLTTLALDESARDVLLSPEEIPLINLIDKLLATSSEEEDQNALKSAFFHKLFFPLFPLLILLFLLPGQQTLRSEKTFFLKFAFSLFLLLFLYLFFESTYLLAKRDVFSPWECQLLPFLIFTAICSGRFLRWSSSN